MRLRRIGVAAVLLLVTGLSPQSFAETNDSLELRVRAAFLYNFARYSSWPPGDSSKVFRFCLAEDAEMLPVLQKAVINKTLNEKPIEIHITHDAADPAHCHLLYLGSGIDLQSWTHHLSAPLGTLVVGEDQNFIQQGGMVGFYMQDGRLKFAISPAQVERAGLTMSSHLLSLATILEATAP